MLAVAASIVNVFAQNLRISALSVLYGESIWTDWRQKKSRKENITPE